MRKFSAIRNLLILIAVLFCTVSSAFAQHKIFLLHPTVDNIENALELVKLKIIDIPDLELVGVYYAKEAYDYTESEKYLKNNLISHYTLMKVSGELNTKNIYEENDCTPAFRKIVLEADAILFFGGPDIQPAIYGEKQHLLTVVTDPNRHLMETSLFFHLIGGSRNPDFKPLLLQKPNLVVRGFCLGMQTMNVAAGGTMVQDIPMEIYHVSTAEGMLAINDQNRHHNYQTELNPGCDISWGLLHPILPTTKGYLHELNKELGQQQPYVWSSHHQAVGIHGKDLQVIATSMDGKIVEAMQHKIFKEVIGVQFHPEQASLYLPEDRYNIAPGSDFSANEQLIKEKSLEFHLKFWRDFSDKIGSLKHQR
ncbi:MAG TPA: gamma-glutamyl-gamma-aminobutyrate hydrolase family protein [Prolixibacteraceae bacterium]|nr:gamma-glutamyl-gamma-aminobutyrate hydrolase family protein [Prolixibacteraceae bacterium]